MKNLITNIFLIALFFSTELSAQTTSFQEVNPFPCDGVRQGSVAYADIDNDNDLDLLITGINHLGTGIAKLYTNDGNGNFSLVNGTPFEAVFYSSIAFADVDNDNDQDVIFTGSLDSVNSICKLYLNDGNGNFYLNNTTPFIPVHSGSVAFSDVDNDNDQDVLISGIKGVSPFNFETKLYLNDGSGNFSLVNGTSFVGGNSGTISFADIDNDNDMDVLLTGANNGYQANLYVNDGNGNFSLMSGTSFDGVWIGSAAFSDVNNDNYLDVLITGINNSNERIAKLYSNDGNGGFNLVTGDPFEGVYFGAVSFSDVNGDNKEDVLITGKNEQNVLTANIYINNGNNIFSLETGLPFSGTEQGWASFLDVDSDGKDDVIITGKNSTNTAISELFRNTSVGLGVVDYENHLGEITIYPNPIEKAFQIKLMKNEKSVKVKILNLIGSVVYNEEYVNVDKITITKEMIPGIYFVEIKIDKSRFIRKILR